MHLCQICKKTPATIHLTDIHNNVKKEVHLCESCAAEKGFNIQGASNLPHLLGLAAKKNAVAKLKKSELEAEEPACPSCGIRWSQFNDRGRLGCPEDYRVFEGKLRQLISGQIVPHVHNADAFHTGKHPGACHGGSERHQTIRNLEKRLRQAVAEENYESAAALKAELDDLRGKNR